MSLVFHVRVCCVDVCYIVVCKSVDIPHCWSLNLFSYNFTADENRELMQKEIYDLKRNLNDEIREKEAVLKTNAELRNKIKVSEAEKVELTRNVQDLKQRVGILEEQKLAIQKEAAELRNTLREVEKARLDARRELQELRRQVGCRRLLVHCLLVFKSCSVHYVCLTFRLRC